MLKWIKIKLLSTLRQSLVLSVQFFYTFVLTPSTQRFNHGPVHLEVLEWQHVSDNTT